MAETQNLYPHAQMNVFLRTCEEEILEPIYGKVTGEIPSWLQGTLLRNGPGANRIGSSRFAHVFDGPALLHRFAISNGEVTYKCRFLCSGTYRKNRKANRIVVTEFGTKSVPDPCHTIFDKFTSYFYPFEKITDNAAVSVYPFGDEIYALTEVPSRHVHRIDPKSLETLEQKNLIHKILVHHTAHPHVEPNGDVYNTGVYLIKGMIKHIVVKFPYTKDGLEIPSSPPPCLEIHNCALLLALFVSHYFVTGNFTTIKHIVVKFPYTKDGDMFESAQIVATMKPRWILNPAYMHSFAITENYFVIIEQPLTINILNSVNMYLNNLPFSSLIGCYPEHETHIVLLHRETGVEKRYRTNTIFFMHTINSYEQNGNLILDLCSYKDSKLIDAMYTQAIENMHSNAEYANWCQSRPKRLVIPLNAPELTKVDAKVIADIGCEIPRINYDHYNAKPYKYFYAVNMDVDSEFSGSLVKVNAESGDVQTWFEADKYPSEPIFVPAPDAKEEDDGVILSVLLNSQNENSAELLILNAHNLSEMGRAYFTTPSPVAKCFHGWFLPEQVVRD